MNLVRTGMLVAALTAPFVAVGFMIAGEAGRIFALLPAGGMNLFTWWNSGKMALRPYRARPVNARSAPALHGIVRQLAEVAGLPMARLYVIDKSQPNAFATRRGLENAAVAATTGLRQRLGQEEIAGVAPAPCGGPWS